MKAELNRVNIIKATFRLVEDRTRLQVELENRIKFGCTDTDDLVNRITSIQKTIDMFNNEIITNHDLL